MRIGRGRDGGTVLGKGVVLTEDREAEMTGVGIIGMGRSGWELHAAHLGKAAGYRLVAACDQSAERLERAAKEFEARPYCEPHSLMED
ncbi:unnamed protein product, partial [marine sediment metagenome]